MAITYTAAVKQARMEAVVTAIGSGGVLEIGTPAMATILATFSLNSVAGTASGAILTLSGFPKSVLASNTDTAAAARIRTATGGTDIVTGLTVDTSAADVILDSVSITAGELVTLSSVIFTHA